MRKNLFTRIFVLYAALALGAFVFFGLYFTDLFRQSHIDTLSEQLTVQARLATDTIGTSTGADIDVAVSSLHRQTGARITVIADGGTVLADSEAEPSRMENHANRPEVMQASIEGTGTAVRYSATLRHNLLYAAVRTGTKDAPGRYVRLAIPLADIDASTRQLRVRIALAVATLLLIISAFSLFQGQRIKRLLKQVTEFSDALAEGELKNRLILEGGGEFEAIALNLNAMAERLGAMMAEHVEEQEHLSAILRSIPDALMILDDKNTVLMASAATRGFFSARAVTGRPVSEIIRSREFFSVLDRAREGREPLEAELMLEQPALRYLIVKVSPLLSEQRGLAGLIVLFNDITEIKRVDQVRKDFVANVSHELKTPISAIKGFADTLLEGAIGDAENARRFVGIIKSNSERINTLVEDLMTISKIELGVIRVEKSPVHVREVMEQTVSLVAERAAAKGLKLDIELDAPYRIEADRNRLIQILTNLVDNAIKFTERGSIKLGVADEGGRALIFVHDTGIGIPSKHLPRIGERFYRVDPSRSREMGGTGLGLAIVKHLVRAHGWQMAVESVERQGTTIKIFVS
jgi:two-component system phosphate regulon sensor histidine kinase PhoR